MLIKTILNRCHKFKSFIYGNAQFVETRNKQVIEIEIISRKNSKLIYLSCHNPAPGYDTQKEKRKFEFILIWGFPVYFIYRMRRVNCPRCGVPIEEVP